MLFVVKLTAGPGGVEFCCAVEADTCDEAKNRAERFTGAIAYIAYGIDTLATLIYAHNRKTGETEYFETP